MNVSEWTDGKPQINAWQQDYIFDRFDDDLAIACCGVGSGKSAALAIWLVLQCSKNPGIRGIMAAQDFGALQKALIREVQIFCDWAHIPYALQRQKEIHFSNGSHLFGYSAENPSSVLGLSEISLLAMDEAAYMPEDMYNFCRDRMRGSKYKSRVRLISSPNSLSRVNSWFSNLVKKYPQRVVYASSLDNKFTDEVYKRELKERYMEGTNLYKQQVLGQIVDGDVASQIVFRRDFNESKRGTGKKRWFGFDASGLGADKDVMVVIDEYGVVDHSELSEADTQVKVSTGMSLYDKYNFESGFADGTGGYSLGTVDLMKAKGLKIEPINFAQRAFDQEKYPNSRTEMYLELAQAVRDGFWVPEDVKIELLAQEVTINHRGQQALAPKELVKKQLGHSPDYCDAVALAVYAMNHSVGVEHETTEEEARDIVDRYMYWHDVL